MLPDGLYLFEHNRSLTLKPENAWWVNVVKDFRTPGDYKFMKVIPIKPEWKVAREDYFKLYLHKEYM